MPRAPLLPPRSPCSSQVASVLKCTMILPASESLHMLFHLSGKLFPPHPTPPYCLFNCFSMAIFQLMCHFLQEACPDDPDAPAPPLHTCRSCLWCAVPHPLDPLMVFTQHIRSEHCLACGQHAINGCLCFPASGFLEAEAPSTCFLRKSPALW